MFELEQFDQIEIEMFLTIKKCTHVIIMIIIMSCRQHRYPWPSLATPPYRSSLLVGPQGYIPYPHRVAVCRFERVILFLLLQQCPACLVHLTLIVFMMRGSCPVGALWGVASRTCSKLLAAFLCSCHQAFSPYV